MDGIRSIMTSFFIIKGKNPINKLPKVIHQQDLV